MPHRDGCACVLKIGFVPDEDADFDGKLKAGAEKSKQQVEAAAAR